MRLRRSPTEIAFRLRQETKNLRFAVFPPKLSAPDFVASFRQLPQADVLMERLRAAPLAQEIVSLADEVAAGRYQLLGYDLNFHPDVPWRADPIHGLASALAYQRRIPYLDFKTVGDHKIIWELNRHQHLVLLAQAYRLTNEQKYLDRIVRQILDWIEENPFERGINWTSALEVAFRALSWMWVSHLCGSHLPAKPFLEALWHHGLFLETNLSFYFSPNTHLLGEAVALHALGSQVPEFPRADRWAAKGAEIVRAEAMKQVRTDGGYFEQSTYYHVYALDMFMFHYILSGKPESLKPVLERMAEYLDAVMGPQRRIPLIGDDDGGRFFHPYGCRETFCRATLCTAGVLLGRQDLLDSTAWPQQGMWWLPETLLPQEAMAQRSDAVSNRFEQTGTVILANREFWTLFDAGPFGPFQSGHSHSDTLSIVLRRKDEDVLIDPGTYTYVGDPQMRDWFRGAAAHNTIRVDKKDQADPVGPFAWRQPPAVRLLQAADQEATGECLYRQIRHVRTLRLEGNRLTVSDKVEGGGEHLIELFWHPGVAIEALSDTHYRLGSETRLTTSQPAVIEPSRRSRVYGKQEACPAIVVRARVSLPFEIESVFEAYLE